MDQSVEIAHAVAVSRLERATMLSLIMSEGDPIEILGSYVGLPEAIRAPVRARRRPPSPPMIITPALAVPNHQTAGS